MYEDRLVVKLSSLYGDKLSMKDRFILFLLDVNRQSYRLILYSSFLMLIFNCTAIAFDRIVFKVGYTVFMIIIGLIFGVRCYVRKIDWECR